MKLKVWKDLTEMQSWTIRNINEFYLGTINYNYSGRSIMKRNKFRKIGTVNRCYGYEMEWKQIPLAKDSHSKLLLQEEDI